MFYDLMVWNVHEPHVPSHVKSMANDFIDCQTAKCEMFLSSLFVYLYITDLICTETMIFRSVCIVHELFVFHCAQWLGIGQLTDAHTFHLIPVTQQTVDSFHGMIDDVDDGGLMVD